MVRSVFWMGLVLVLIGLLGFGMGYLLLPTDVGRAWLGTGATFATGGMVILALGAVGAQISGALIRQPDTSLASAVGNTGGAAPSYPDTYEPELSAPGAIAPEPAVPALGAVMRAGVAAAGGVAAGAAAMAFAKPGLEKDKPGPEKDKPGPEKDKPAHEEEAHDPMADDLLGTRAHSVATPLADEEMDLFASAEPDEHAEERAEAGLRGPLGGAEPHDAAMRDAEADDGDEMPLPLKEPLLRPALAADAEAFEAEDDNPPEDTEAPERVEAPATVASALASPSPGMGLIADDDLAALEQGEAPLAPLGALEVVGAYDSGGVRFTMYSDGSVHAVGPAGERRFRTLEALRAHLDTGQSAV